MRKGSYYILLFLLVIATKAFSIDISSTLFDQRIDGETGYKEIKFKNNSTESIRYKVKVLKSKDKDMSKWVEITPKVLNIPPMGERMLKIFAQSPKGIKNGEYNFNLQIEPIVIPTIIKAKSGEIRGGSTVTFTPIIEMSGYVGDPNFKENIIFKDIKIEKNKKEYILTGILENNTFAGKDIGFSFVGYNDFIVDGKWIGRLGANSKNSLNLTVNNWFKEILIYDSQNNEEIKRIKMPEILNK